MTPFRDQSLTGFLEAMAAKTSTPGGGSASALAAAMGAGLVAMVIQFSLKKAVPQEVPDLENRLAELTRLRLRLLDLVDEDSSAYEQMRAAYKSQQGVQAAVQRASAVPLETAHCAFQVLEQAEHIAAIGNPNLVSDVGVGASLAFAAVQGACMNVTINLSSLEDHTVRTRWAEESKGLIQRSHDTTIPLLQKIHKRMSPS